jgi:hypothetical protein
VRAGLPKQARSCLATLDFLLPPQRYGDADLVRAIVVDQDQVYFRNMRDVFKVSLAGGAVSQHSRGPGLSLLGTTVLWTSGERLLTQLPPPASRNRSVPGRPPLPIQAILNAMSDPLTVSDVWLLILKPPGSG